MNVEKKELNSEDTNPIGDWVRVGREKVKLSQLEFARQVGISQAQVSNLEAGKIRNPQRSTREKLEKIIGPIPATVKEEAAQEQRVEGLGVLTDFDPYDNEELPDCPGVYVFYDITDRPVYVGQATRRPIRARVQEHYDKFWFKRPIVERASFIQVDDEKLCSQIEQVLIKFLKSNALLNKQHVERE